MLLLLLLLNLCLLLLLLLLQHVSWLLLLLLLLLNKNFRIVHSRVGNGGGLQGGRGSVELEPGGGRDRRGLHLEGGSRRGHKVLLRKVDLRRLLLLLLLERVPHSHGVGRVDLRLLLLLDLGLGRAHVVGTMECWVEAVHNLRLLLLLLLLLLRSPKLVAHLGLLLLLLLHLRLPGQVEWRAGYAL